MSLCEFHTYICTYVTMYFCIVLFIYAYMNITKETNWHVKNVNQLLNSFINNYRCCNPKNNIS